MGSAKDEPILALHNRNVGLVYEDGNLYAGSCIEIPVYEPVAVAAKTPPVADDQKKGGAA